MGKNRRGEKEEKEGLQRKTENRGGEREKKGVLGESFSRGLGRGKNTLGNTLQEGDTGILPVG